MLTKEHIQNSLEAKWRKSQIKTYFVIFAVFAVIFFLAMFFGIAIEGFSVDNLLFCIEILGILYAVYAACLLPFVLFSWHKYRSLFKNLDAYTVYEVMLDEPATAPFYRGAIYYTVTIPLSSGKTVKIETKPLWSSGIFSSIQLADYNNKMIKVAYSESLDQLIIIEPRKETPV